MANSLSQRTLPRGRLGKPERNASLAEDYQRGLSAGQLAEKYEISRPRVGQILERYFPELQAARQAARAKNRTLRRRLRMAPGLRRRIFERDAYRCRHCGGWYQLTVDHIVPGAQGGTNAEDNLQTLCAACNFRKGSLPDSTASALNQKRRTA